jgi:hypothetical protein
MKTYKPLLGLLLMAMIFSCQKEKSYEKGAAGTSSGSLQSATTGDCLGSAVSGTYKKDTVLNSSNYVDVQIDVTKTGSYVVSTDTINGFYFKAAGTFTATGVTSVRLLGNGKPITGGTNIFTVAYDSTQCTFPIVTLDGGTGGTSVFTLAGSPNACTSATVQGIYTAGLAATSSNTATIQVDVTTAGTYSIATTAVNGITFSALGTLTTTGTQPITLTALGTPAAAGLFTIPISVGSSNCSFQVTVVAGSPAAYTLAGSPNACTGATVQGTYTTGVSLTTSNTATVQVNVTTVGTYSITTTAVGGITFTGSGSFSSAGVQSVVLAGSGTPTTAGANVITVTAGNSSCTFTVNVTQGVANSDLFPLTTNSWWSYDDVDGLFVNAGDSLKRVDINTLVYTGNSLPYNVFQEQDNTTPFDSFYYRRSGNDYFELNVADVYSQFSFDSLVVGDINFLKEGLASNQSWTSAEFSGKMNNSPAKLQYAYTCTAASTTATINGNNFNNVYKISWKPRINLNNTGYVDEPGTTYESWYAKGVGLIYFKATIASGSAAINIKHWQVF